MQEGFSVQSHKVKGMRSLMSLQEVVKEAMRIGFKESALKIDEGVSDYFIPGTDYKKENSTGLHLPSYCLDELVNPFYILYETIQPIFFRCTKRLPTIFLRGRIQCCCSLDPDLPARLSLAQLHDKIS